MLTIVRLFQLHSLTLVAHNLYGNILQLYYKTWNMQYGVSIANISPPWLKTVNTSFILLFPCLVLPSLHRWFLSSPWQPGRTGANRRRLNVQRSIENCKIATTWKKSHNYSNKTKKHKIWGDTKNSYFLSWAELVYMLLLPIKPEPCKIQMGGMVLGHAGMWFLCFFSGFPAFFSCFCWSMWNTQIQWENWGGGAITFKEIFEIR